VVPFGFGQFADAVDEGERGHEVREREVFVQVVLFGGFPAVKLVEQGPEFGAAQGWDAAAAGYALSLR
jgi:hypothetical protein